MKTTKRISDVPAFRARLQSLLDYDPDTGIFTWRVNKGRAKVGQTAGTLSPGPSGNNYTGIMIDRQKWQAHRLAWVYYYGIDPPEEVEHEDSDGLNNRISNLQLSDRQTNSKNSRLRSDNTSGHCGVVRLRHKFNVRIMTGSGRRHYGSYDTMEQAAAAYEQLKLEHGYHPEHGLPRST